MSSSSAAVSILDPSFSSSWLVSVEFDGSDAVVIWCDGEDVERQTPVEILTESRGYGRRVRFSCEVVGDLPLKIAHEVAELAEDRALDDYWGA